MSSVKQVEGGGKGAGSSPKLKKTAAPKKGRPVAKWFVVDIGGVSYMAQEAFRVKGNVSGAIDFPGSLMSES